nr:serine/arginine repetitive matrix protein 3 isoform X2 [Helicoverpa armigera]
MNLLATQTLERSIFDKWPLSVSFVRNKHHGRLFIFKIIMDEICRLCCSTKFVNNDIFDEENALYLKMSLYLPIKVFKNDRLPRKVCDKCSCKVNDFYQFCNETIEVQNRLRSLFLSSEACINASIDLTLVKHSASPPPSQPVQCERSTQTDEPGAPPACEVTVQVKHEPDSVSLSPVKKEEDNYYHIDSDHFDDGSSGSDDISLISLKKKKSKGSTLNGVHATDKKARKKAANMKEWGELMESLPDATLTVVESGEPGMPLDSIKEEMLAEKPQDVFHCCTCFTQCYSRAEMVQHYRRCPAASGRRTGRGTGSATAAPTPARSARRPSATRTRYSSTARRTSWRRAARRSRSTSASCATCVPRPSSTCATCSRTARARTRRRRGGRWRCAAGCARAASRTSTRCGGTCARTRASATSCAACAARRCRRASTSSSTRASTRATSPTCAPCAARASSRSATSRCTSACTRARSRTCARTAARPSASAPRSSSTSATTAARGPTCAGSAAAASSPRGCSPCISRPPASSHTQRAPRSPR